MTTRTLTLSLLGAAGALALSATAAGAQPWRDAHNRWVSIDQRQAMLDQRIDRGVQRGDLTRREARNLRMEFRQIARLEARYRMNGLSNWERADLDRRFDHLASQIHLERNDRQVGYGYRH